MNQPGGLGTESSARLRVGTTAGRWVLMATVLASTMVMFDATVVNVALPALAGLSGDDYRDPAAFAAGYEIAVWIAAALAASGGIIAWLTIRDEPPPGGWAVTEPQCPLDAPPLRAVPRW